MGEESGRPGTWRSKVGWEPIEEPWTKRIVPRGSVDPTAAFSQRNRRTGPFWVQCSRPRTAGSAVMERSFLRAFGHSAGKRSGFESGTRLRGAGDPERLGGP